jgi:predicted dehydrogenase
MLKAAIIGTGLIAKTKHIPSFKKLKNKMALTAVCDVNLDAARQVAAEFGIPNAYADMNEMLAKEKPDMVDICTPPKTHVSIAVEGMKSKANVFIEKPMALSLEECDQILHAENENGVQVCVGHSDLFYYPFIEARKLVNEGAIGEFRGMRIFLSTPVNYITSKPDHWANKLPGGVIGETGPHIIYMTLAFINPIKNVSIDAMKLLPEYPWSPFEDYRINLIGDKTASSVYLTYTSDQWAANIDIVGSKDIIRIDLEGMYLLRSKRPNLGRITVGKSVISESVAKLSDVVTNGIRVITRNYMTTHDLLLSNFADSINSGSPSPVPASEGRESVRVLGVLTDKLKSQYGI